MKKNNKTPVILFFIFCLFLSITTLISFSSNTTTQEVIIKSITPIYDTTSTIEVNQNNIIFNDKNQVVKYNVVLENTQDYDVKISDITLSTPTEEFLDYKVEGISKDDVLSANSTKEITVSFETMRIDGWGRNFADELTANISFEKYLKQEEDTEEEKQPKAPAANAEELTSKTEEIKVIRVTNDTIEFNETEKLQTGDKIAVWLYSTPKFLGYFDVIVTNGVKQIVGLEEALKKVEVKTGEHNIALVSQENVTLGYISVYVNENKEVLKEKVQDKTDKEETNPATKPSTESTDKEENPKDEENKIENPYTSDKGLIIILGIATCVTGVTIIIVSKNKIAKYTVFILMLSPVFTITNAEEVIEISIKNNVSFESQNVMKMAYTIDENNKRVYHDYWYYNEQLKNFYISNEIKEVEEYVHKFDVTEKQNGRVIAYLITNKEDSNFYDLYLQADGVIYPNTDASFYFDRMKNLDKIDNLSGFDTSEVVNMKGMFQNAGYYSPSFTMDVSGFDTSNVVNMGAMFNKAGHNSSVFELDVSKFDTSNVTNMYSMFQLTGYTNPNFSIDVSNFDTSNVTNMMGMFSQTGFNSSIIQIDVSSFDTSKVTTMKAMFQCIGNNNQNFTLDVGNFDTSNVTDMSHMFSLAGFYSTKFKLDVSNFATSKVTDMSYMFADTGYNSTEFSIDISNFDTRNLVNTEGMFYNLGYNSTKLNTSITIKNPNVNNYSFMFLDTAMLNGSQIKVNYTAETEELVDKMIATKTEGANVVKGNLIVDVDKLSTGDEIHISGEKFNVISQTDDTVTMLAQYNIGTDYKQSTTNNYVKFADNNGWEYKPGPKEIDIQEWSTITKTYINDYVEFLKETLGNNAVAGDLITLKDLESLGCTIPSDYTLGDDASGRTCINSSYKSWLINSQSCWTRSAESANSDYVWRLSADGYLRSYSYNHDYSLGVRPTITISKDTLRNLNTL